MAIQQETTKALNQIARKWIKLNPIRAADVGVEEEFNSLVPETEDAIKSRVKFLKDAAKEVSKLKPETKHETRMVQLAKYLIEKWRIELEELKYWSVYPAATEYIIDALHPLIAIDYAPLSERITHLHSRMKILPKRIREIWQRVSNPVRPLIEMELETITRLPGLFFQLQEISREGAKQKVYKEIYKFSEQCLDEIEEMYQYIISGILSDCKNERLLDPDIYNNYVSHLLQRKDIGKIVVQAEEQLEYMIKKLQYYGNKVARRQTVDVAVSMMKDLKAGNMQELLQFCKQVAGKAYDFAKENNFCTMPDKDTLYILEEPACYVHYNPLYLYRNGGNFCNSNKGFLFLASSDCDLDKTRELNFPLTTSITTRLSYPGKHLYYILNRSSSSLLESVNDTTFTVDGWSEYSAVKLNELGFEDTMKHAFMNYMNLVRMIAKFIAEIKLFSGKFTIKEAIAYVARHSCFDWAITEVEVNRIVTQPGRQIYPYYGWDTIMTLEKSVKKELKTGFKQQRFNNFILSLANFPIHLLDDMEKEAEKFMLKVPSGKRIEKITQ